MSARRLIRVGLLPSETNAPSGVALPLRTAALERVGGAMVP
jgi:hypothetical protein